MPVHALESAPSPRAGGRDAASRAWLAAAGLRAWTIGATEDARDNTRYREAAA